MSTVVVAVQPTKPLVVQVKTGPPGPPGAIVGAVGTGFLYYNAGVVVGARAVDPTLAPDFLVGAANTVLTSNGAIGVWQTIVNANVNAAANIAVSKLAAGSNTFVLTTVAGVPTWAAAASGFTPPTGTGFMTVTSSAMDAVATTNIRYTGGKFQTNTNIQYQNLASGPSLGDLAWLPTTTRTLTLPDATDTLVGKATTDTFTNKTYAVDGTGNVLKQGTPHTGDILVDNGTKFAPVAQGANGTFWGVSGGVAGYYTPAGGTITGADTQVLFFDGANNPAGDADFTWNKTTNVLTITTGLAVGATPATAGSIRLPSGGDIEGRNAANSANIPLLTWDASNFLTVGPGTAAGAGVKISVPTGTAIAMLVNSSNVVSLSGTLDTHSIPIDVGSNYYQGGSLPATAGRGRFGNTDAFMWRNASNTANKGIALNGSDIFAFDASIDVSTSNSVRGGGGSYPAAGTFRIGSTVSTGATLIAHNDGIGDRTLIDIPAGSTYGFGDGVADTVFRGSTVYLHTSSNHAVFSSGPLRGEIAAASPWAAHGDNTITVVGGTYTLSATEASYAQITCGGTAAQTNVDFPTPAAGAGYYRFVINTNTNGVILRKAGGGGNTVTMNTTSRACIVYVTSGGVYRYSADTVVTP